jgi:DUF1680 family protein
VAGQQVTITQEGDYPWSETVTVRVGVGAPTRFALHLRVPEWAGSASVAVGRGALEQAMPDAGGYLTLDREWKDGDFVTLYLPMGARLMHPHPRVRADTGRVALMRGPLVYCAEGADNGADLDLITLPAQLSGVQTATVADLGGAVAFDVPALVESDEAWGKAIYLAAPPKAQTAVRRFIPYHLWDNRTPGEMLVWVRRAADA